MDNFTDYRLYWDSLTDKVGPVQAVTYMDPQEYADYFRPILSAAIQPPTGLSPRNLTYVLDLGCGPALILPLLKEMLPGDLHYTGLDVSPEMIDYCKATYPTEGVFEVVDTPDLPYLSVFDLVLVHSVFTHIYPADALEYLKSIHAALTPDGRASVSIHASSNMEEWSGAINQVNYAPAFFENMLIQSGFKILSAHAARQIYYLVEKV